MDNLDALVSVALVLGLIVGTLLLTAILCVQVGELHSGEVIKINCCLLHAVNMTVPSYMAFAISIQFCQLHNLFGDLHVL